MLANFRYKVGTRNNLSALRLVRDGHSEALSGVGPTRCLGGPTDSFDIFDRRETRCPGEHQIAFTLSILCSGYV